VRILCACNYIGNTCRFLFRWRYKIDESKIYQDNQSTILLAKNGRGSSSKRTRHINIRYVFVTDRVKRKEFSVEYCPTGEMNADFVELAVSPSLRTAIGDL
jgi:hypothetical protein